MTAREITKLNSRVTISYFGFLFQSFFKRPFGYIIALLYIFYLSVILMIVPSASHLRPLVIWSNAAFNMPIFNLFFISAVAAAIAVILFRVGIEDGTELSLSAKPITKHKRVLIKTAVYIIIMIMINAITLILLALIKPIFGEFNILTNPTGITDKEYRALLLSVLVGNIVNMLLFGGIAVFISLVGGQVITMIGSIGIAFILCLLNFIYPLLAGKPKTVLMDTYNTSINSISSNTLAQIKGSDTSTNFKSWAAIQTTTEASGEEINHMDTYEYWTKAEKQSFSVVTNYFDFGKQLSLLYSSFGLDDSKQENVQRGAIGLNNMYKYKIDPNSHVTTDYNKAAENYPVCVYGILSKQGVSYPIVRILGGNTGLDIKNWTILSQATKSDYNSLTVLSKDPELILSNRFFREEVAKSYWTLEEINYWRDKYEITYDEAYNASKALLETYYKTIANEFNSKAYSMDLDEPTSAISIISEDQSGVFFQKGKWQSLSFSEKSFAISNIILYWTVLANEWQRKQIDDWKITSSNPLIHDDSFPYSSLTVKTWYEENILDQEGTVKSKERYNFQKLIEQIIYSGVYCGEYSPTTSTDPIPVYVNPINSRFEYCETFKNLYTFTVQPYFNVYIIMAIWTSVAIALFAASIIIYRKTDFK